MDDMLELCAILNRHGVKHTFTEKGINPQIKIAAKRNGEEGFYSIIKPFDYRDDSMEIAFVTPRDVEVLLAHARPQAVYNYLEKVGIL